MQADGTFLRTNPEAEVFVFSPLQYGAHVRDMLKVYGDRMVLGLEQDKPTSPLSTRRRRSSRATTNLAPMNWRPTSSAGPSAWPR
jgi:hypothetical protein